MNANNFMSLEDFLSIDFDGDHTSKQRSEWLKHYKKANLSYSIFGDNGPEINSQVIDLRLDQQKIFLGVSDRDFDYFELKSIITYSVSLCPINHWYFYIFPYDLVNIELFPEYYNKKGEKIW